MTEQEILQRAQSYIDKMANGINPLTDEQIPDTDLVNNVNICRCLSYVSNILKNQIRRNEYISRRNGNNKNTNTNTAFHDKSKQPFFIDGDTLKKFPFKQNGYTITNLTNAINNLIDSDKINTLKFISITSFLAQSGLLELKNGSRGVKTPTPLGNSYDINAKESTSNTGETYTLISYGPKAQQFILDNMDAIIKINNNPNYSISQNAQKPFSITPPRPSSASQTATPVAPVAAPVQTSPPPPTPAPPAAEQRTADAGPSSPPLPVRKSLDDLATVERVIS